MKTLIVEDDFTSRFFLQKMMVKYGYCDVAVNGKEALDAFILAYEEDSPYDLILLDIMMPEMNGKEALKRIRSYERSINVSYKKEVKIIMLTALDSPQDVIESFYQGGCSAYIVKPVEKVKLVEVLKEYKLL